MVSAKTPASEVEAAWESVNDGRFVDPKRKAWTGNKDRLESGDLGRSKPVTELDFAIPSGLNESKGAAREN